MKQQQQQQQQQGRSSKSVVVCFLFVDNCFHEKSEYQTSHERLGKINNQQLLYDSIVDVITSPIKITQKRIISDRDNHHSKYESLKLWTVRYKLSTIIQK